MENFVEAKCRIRQESISYEISDSDETVQVHTFSVVYSTDVLYSPPSAAWYLSCSRFSSLKASSPSWLAEASEVALLPRHMTYWSLGSVMSQCLGWYRWNIPARGKQYFIQWVF